MTTQCYGVDGTPHKPGRYIPCNITAVENGGHTGCCAPGDNCLTNGLCQGQSDEKRKANLYWRNGCTDPTWESAACSRHCVGLGEPDTHAVFYCLQADSWCCPTGAMDLGKTINTTCCNVSDLVFQAADPIAYTIAEEEFARTATTTTRSLSATALSQSTTTTADSSSIAPSSQASAGALVSATPSSSSASRTGIYAGVPIGIVGAVTLGIIAWFVIRKPNASRADGAVQGLVENQGAEKHPYIVEADLGRRPLEMLDGQEVRAELPEKRGR
ncbi:Nn.00g085820.m01.CDS01 [Neocucurbitaria sp. VM-36]